MALLTNPMTADLQSRIQNSSFGSPDYLQGFQGTMPAWQQNMLMQTYTPGETGLLGGGNPSVPDYTGYIPGGFTPPALQQPNPLAGLQGSINQFLPQMGGGGGDADPNRQKGVFGGKYETFGGKMFSFTEDGVPTEVEGTPFTSPIINFLAGLSGKVPGEEERRFNQLTDAQKKTISNEFANQVGSYLDETGAKQSLPIRRPPQYMSDVIENVEVPIQRPTPVINRPRPQTQGGGGGDGRESQGYGGGAYGGADRPDRPGGSDASNW